MQVSVLFDDSSCSSCITAHVYAAAPLLAAPLQSDGCSVFSFPHFLGLILNVVALLNCHLLIPYRTGEISVRKHVRLLIYSSEVVQWHHKDSETQCFYWFSLQSQQNMFCPGRPARKEKHESRASEQQKCLKIQVAPSYWSEPDELLPQWFV